MDHYPPCRVPLLKSTVGDPLTIDRVAFTLAEMLQEAGSNADKTSLVIGLCNAVSLCLGSMVEEPVTTERRQILLMFQRHLQAMAESLKPFSFGVFGCAHCGAKLVRNDAVPSQPVWDCPDCKAYWTWIAPPVFPWPVAPPYNHTRGDSALTPCEVCEKWQRTNG